MVGKVSTVVEVSGPRIANSTLVKIKRWEQRAAYAALFA
jgi:hypothetical protein